MALKEKADKELAQYNMELKVVTCMAFPPAQIHPCIPPQELVRVIDHDRRLKEFMNHKDQERTEAHLEMEEAKKRKSRRNFLNYSFLLSCYISHSCSG